MPPGDLAIFSMWAFLFFCLSGTLHSRYSNIVL